MATQSKVLNGVLNASNANISIKGNNQTISQNVIQPTGPYGISCNGQNNNVTDNYIYGSNQTISNISHPGIIETLSVDGIDIEDSNNLVYGNTITAVTYGIGVGGNSFGNIVAKNNITGCGSGIVVEGSNNTVIANALTNNGGGLWFTGFNNIFYSNRWKTTMLASQSELTKQT